MPATYEPIATQTLGSAASSITFSSIPATYTDLRVVFIGGNNASATAFYFQVNGDTGSNYSRTFLTGDGATAASSRASNSSRIQSPMNLSATIPTFISFDIFSYAGSNNKTVLASFSADRNGSGVTSALVGLWRSTSAITSVNLSTPTDAFGTGTTATLYGIKNA